MPSLPRGNRVQHAGIERPFGDQRSATLLRHADELLFHALLVDVGEMHIVELHAADLLELLLDPAANLKGVFEAPPHGFLVVFLVGIQQLQQARDSVLAPQWCRAD